MENFLLNYKQMAKLFLVEESTVRNWVNKKQIPEDIIFKMPGKKGAIRFIKPKLEEWITKSNVKELYASI